MQKKAKVMEDSEHCDTSVTHLNNGVSAHNTKNGVGVTWPDLINLIKQTF